MFHQGFGEKSHGIPECRIPGRELETIPDQLIYSGAQKENEDQKKKVDFPPGGGCDDIVAGADGSIDQPRNCFALPAAVFGKTEQPVDIDKSGQLDRIGN